MEIFKLLIPAISASMCNTIANLFWKIEFARQPLNITSIKKIFILFFSVNIMIGIFFYGISMLLFFYMLSNFKLSLIIPLTAFTYIFNILLAYVVFNEKIYYQSIIGTVIILIGMIILSQTPISLTD